MADTPGEEPPQQAPEPASSSAEPAEPAPAAAKPTVAKVEPVAVKDLPPPNADDVKRAKKACAKVLKELKTLADNNSIKPEERVAQLLAKLEASIVETARHKREALAALNRTEQLKKEADEVSNRMSTAKSLSGKLLQQGKTLEAEKKKLLESNRRVATEEHKARQELTEEFNGVIIDVRNQMEKQEEERLKGMEENEGLRIKFRELLAQYETSERSQQEELKEKILEEQMSLMKLQETEEHRLALMEQNHVLKETEKLLKAQLKEYAEKFGTFKDTFAKSHEAFESMKKQNAELKRRDDQTSKALIRLDADKSKALAQKESLEKLCKSLRQELQDAQARLEKLEALSKERGGAGEAPCADPEEQPASQDGPPQ
mmetsp:Transcript_51551/g.110492  ORF Transcript_51551/g.110492 Transcript_51551/m.110492 type:complete len:374 (-) Transcript_51551:100-1221(-)